MISQDNKGDNIKYSRVVSLLNILALKDNWFSLSERVENYLYLKKEEDMDLLFEEFYNELSDDEKIEFDNNIPCSSI